MNVDRRRTYLPSRSAGLASVAFTRAPRLLAGRARVATGIVAVGIVAAPAGGQEVCERLGSALTEHSCFHAEFGPWETVTAEGGRVPSSRAPNIDAVHTQWLVRLPQGPAVVTYRPQRGGQWVVFTEPPGLIAIDSDQGAALAVEYDSPDTNCPYFGRAQAFNFTQGQNYRFIFDPAAAGADQVVVVIEKVDDFLVVAGRDADGDGYGDPADVTVTACEPAPGFVTNDADCNDADPTIHPGQADACDGLDNDCDGAVDNPREACGQGVGRCALRGTLVCRSEGQPAECVVDDPDAEPLEPAPEICNGQDDDCDGVVDGVSAGDSLCPDSDTPVCVALETETRCGCAEDSDCGPVDGGIICDATERRCVAGCYALPGRHGCPAAQACSSVAPAAPGQCVPECSLPGRCSPEDENLEERLDATGVEPLRVSGGCGCQAGVSGVDWKAALGTLAALAIAGLRSRRRRAGAPSPSGRRS